MSLDVILLIGRVLLAAALYTFIGLLFYFIWQDLRMLQHDTRPAGQALAYVRVLRSDLNELAPGERFTLHERTRIGRAATCDITLPDEFVSLEHARITYQAGQWWLIDGQSHNGTRLNGAPIDEDVILAPGDEIGIGRVTLTFELRTNEA